MVRDKRRAARDWARTCTSSCRRSWVLDLTAPILDLALAGSIRRRPGSNQRRGDDHAILLSSLPFIFSSQPREVFGGGHENKDDTDPGGDEVVTGGGGAPGHRRGSSGLDSGGGASGGGRGSRRQSVSTSSLAFTIHAGQKQHNRPSRGSLVHPQERGRRGAFGCPTKVGG